MLASRIFKFALFSRLCVILFQVIFNLCVPDHKADAFRLPFIEESGSANILITYLLSGFTRWDAQYFLHITLYGYTHENTLAFFPLFPISVRGATYLISIFFSPLLHDLNCALLAGVIVNCFLFSLATFFLYQLTFTVFQSDVFALTSAFLFCFNPASIFFSTLYSESLFACFTFGGLYALENNKYLWAVIALSLCAVVRSNGILCVGFIVYMILKKYIKSIYNIHNVYSFDAIKFLNTILIIIFYILLFIIPFSSYQIYCYLLFCTSYIPELEMPEIVVDYVTRNDLKLPSDPSKWCLWKIPLSYSYVQSRYWDVGFLNYYTVKQLPNFLLAAPIFFIITIPCLKYFSKNCKKILPLVLVPDEYASSDIYSCTKGFPYFCHAFFVTLFCTLFIHVQVITRILCSSSPILYWVAATALLPNNDRARFKILKECSYKCGLQYDLYFMKKLFFRATYSGRIVFSYFICYFFIGIFLHVNFFPWT